ncbi:MAG: hypothetical protein AAGE98_11320 [Actinomycetota bacterium]
MTLKFLLRLLDNLFRHPIRYLVPVILLGAYGAATLPSDDEYSSTGVVFVEDASFLSSVTNVGGADFTFGSPADVAVEQLFGLLGTDTFASDVLRRIEGAEPGTTYSEDVLFFFRTGIGVGSRPGSLLEVTGSSADPATAQASAQGVIDAYVAWQIEADLAQSQSAEAFLLAVADERLAELDAAQEALRAFLLLNPDPIDGSTRPTSEQVTLGALEDEVEASRTRYEAALDNVETAQLAISQTEVDTRVNLRVVDSPALPLAPESRTVSNAIQVLLFMILGAGASLGVLLMTTFTDTSVRFPAEIRERLGKEAFAVVPRVQ